MTNNNVRIRSSVYGTVHASWTVRPSESSERMPAIWRELDDLNEYEPGMSWVLETRGEDSDWHQWQND